MKKINFALASLLLMPFIMHANQAHAIDPTREMMSKALVETVVSVGGTVSRDPEVSKAYKKYQKAQLKLVKHILKATNKSLTPLQREALLKPLNALKEIVSSPAFKRDYFRGTQPVTRQAEIEYALNIKKVEAIVGIYWPEICVAIGEYVESSSHSPEEMRVLLEYFIDHFIAALKIKKQR